MRWFWLILMLLPCLAAADSTTIISGTSGIEDTYMDDDNPTTNYGSGADLWVYLNNFNGDTMNAMIRCMGVVRDTIPDTATVNACSLIVTVTAKSPSPSTVNIYSSCRPWVESQATWQLWKTSYNWTKDGAAYEAGNPCVYNENDGTGNDRGIDFLGSFSATVATHRVELDTSWANSIVRGEDSLNGLVLFTGSASTYATISSSEDGSDSMYFKFVWSIDTSAAFSDNRHGDVMQPQRHGPNPSLRHGRP